MIHSEKVVELELSKPIETIENLDNYIALRGLVRLHGHPIGYVRLPIANGRCTADALSRAILDQHSQAIINRLLENGLAVVPQPEGLSLQNLLELPQPTEQGEFPLVTVAVCTRDRPDSLKVCLEAISRLDYPALDLLVIDNAPSTDATEQLVQQQYPQVRYVCEPRPGLDWARNRAIVEAQGEIIGVSDDDVVVDSGWV